MLLPTLLSLSLLIAVYGVPRGTVNTTEFDTELASNKRAATAYTGESMHRPPPYLSCHQSDGAVPRVGLRDMGSHPDLTLPMTMRVQHRMGEPSGLGDACLSLELGAASSGPPNRVTPVMHEVPRPLYPLSGRTS